jgi:hypothetical protein
MAYDQFDPSEIVWEATTPCYIKYVTHDRYTKFSVEVRKWYKPYRCSCCADRLNQSKLNSQG